MKWKCLHAMLVLLVFATAARGEDVANFRQAEENGVRFNDMALAIQRVMKAWLSYADSKTLLLPDHLPGEKGRKATDVSRLYTPHNSGADLYSYLILTSALTDPDLFRGRMMEMLRNEVRYTTRTDAIPANLDLNTGELGPPSLFGAAEYAKDGLVAVTELLGRSPWFYRMTDMIVDLMNQAPVSSRFGKLPGSDAEINGDVLQVLVRLASMTGDSRYLDWARRIGDAYLDEVLPAMGGLPAMKWDFTHHRGETRLVLDDHGNESIVGLVLLFALENASKTSRATHYRPIIAKMLDRVLESANPDGMLYNAIDTATLKPLDQDLTDTWGYVYGAVYTFYQCTGEVRYRDAVRRVLRNLPKYRNYRWDGGSFDGYADSIESAIYLTAREPLPEAFDWIESEMRVMTAMQKPSGLIEYWYGEGNFNRTVLLYMYYKSQGCRPDRWVPGLQLGAVKKEDRLYLSLETAAEARQWDGKIEFDFARHRRIFNFDKNYVRLNEFPEWFVVDENTLYRLSSDLNQEHIFLGSELIAGVHLSPGHWIVEPLRRSPQPAGPRPH